MNDSDNQRVSMFDTEGTFVETWPYPSRGGIAVAADDTVYISDVNAGIVNIVKTGSGSTASPPNGRTGWGSTPTARSTCPARRE